MAETDKLPYHRKYRPTTLKGYIGNEKMKDIAMKSLRDGKRPQVVFIYGDTGCGKTTFARLLAKEYSCENRDDDSGACGECSSCNAVDDYITTGDTSILTNIKEVNISEQSGKNDLDDIIEDMNIPAFGDEWKVFIFDECHKASDGLQNMLLKPIEEPPENVLMIFCTTNPEKMIPTFINRQQLKLHVTKPTVKELSGLLRGVCEKEQVEFDQRGLEFIANRGELTIRDALTNLELVVNTQGGAKYENATQVFEEVSNTLVIDFFTALKKQDTLRFVTLLTQIKAKMELSVFLSEINGFVKRGIYTINGVEQDGVSDNELKVYRDLFGTMSIQQIASLVNKLLSFRNSNNLELELLLWGYSGLVTQESKKEDMSSLVQPLDKELASEKRETSRIIKVREEENYEKGVKNAENLMTGINMQDIISMGATLVE